MARKESYILKRRKVGDDTTRRKESQSTQSAEKKADGELQKKKVPTRSAFEKKKPVWTTIRGKNLSGGRE